MPKGRKTRSKSVRPRKKTPRATRARRDEAASSLPPTPADPAQPLPTSAATLVPEELPAVEPPSVPTIGGVPAKMDSPHIARVKALPKNSMIRRKALMILAMRLDGLDDEEIAKQLGLTKSSLRQYIWMAGKNGWIPSRRGFVDPKDEIEFSLAHKVVRNLQEAMDDETRNSRTGMPVKTEVALKVAEGTLFKRFNETATQQQQTTVLAVKIEMPPGVQTTIREGTTAGVPRWKEAEVLDAE